MIALATPRSPSSSKPTDDCHRSDRNSYFPVSHENYPLYGNCIVCRAILGYYQMWVYPYFATIFLWNSRYMYDLLCIVLISTEICVVSFSSSSKFCYSTYLREYTYHSVIVTKMECLHGDTVCIHLLQWYGISWECWCTKSEYLKKILASDLSDLL